MTEASPILPRELTEGLSDEVRNIPPPPTPILPELYALRLVEAWESAWPASRWRQYLRAQLDGGYSRPLVGSLHGQAGGYFEVYRAARDSIATRYHADAYDIGLHPAISELTLVNKGLRRLLLPDVITSVFEAEPRCRRIMFAPDHRNNTARRVCEFAGCTFLGEHDMSNRRMALYALPRSPADIPAAR